MSSLRLALKLSMLEENPLPAKKKKTAPVVEVSEPTLDDILQAGQ
jgi:hypothetical protein